MIPSSVTSEIKRKLPIFRWCSEYDLPSAICDLIAGVTVGLTLIPQAIAYASLAGLEPQVRNCKCGNPFDFFASSTDCTRRFAAVSFMRSLGRLPK